MDHDKYIGRLLDNRYEILEVIGVGGMAVVYKARCHRLNRLVAIKILKDELSQDKEFRNRFHAEGQAVAMLSHPNIVSVYDVSVGDDADYIVMELVDGISLKQYMEKKGFLNWKETLHFAMQIAKALEHAHSRGIVHRDIKPHNVMVLKNGSVKVTDFGIARVMSNSDTLTKEALGSVHYISPEQAKGGRVDNRSDLYSLGVVMYEMLSGRPPYDGDSPVAVAIQHINGGAPLPTTFNPNIPSGLEQIIMKAMALDPNDRYPTATAMLYDMDELRKNPVMLFDFQNVPIDDATRLQMQDLPDIPEPPQEKPMTVARRHAGGSTSRQGRPGSTSRRSVRRERDESSRAATVAIVACSLVAVVAIVIFMVMIFNSDFLSPVPSMVQVPDLRGQQLESVLANYPQFDIVEGERTFSTFYEKGEIITQNPKPNTSVASGSTITVVVSLGKEEAVEKTMDDLIGLSQEDAKKFLEDMDLNLDVRIQEETGSLLQPGQVIRTNPAKGEVLVPGQIVVLYVVPGAQIPETQLQMPDFLGKKESVALMLLKGSGFTNYRTQPVDSDRPQGEVVDQSITPGVWVEAGREVVLYVSNGVTTPPTTKPTDPPTQATEGSVPIITEDVVFHLPEGWTRSYSLRILTARDQVVLEETLIQPDQTQITLRLTGSGAVEYKMYIDGEFYRSMIWNFNANG